MTLPELALDRRVTTAMIIVSIVALGLVALVRLPLAFLPDVEEPRIWIVLPYENASPDQVERLVVRPVEDAMSSMSGLQGMWSRCDADGGRVQLRFNWSEDMRVKRVDVWERLDRIRRDLPGGLGDIQVGSNWDAREADKPILEGRLSSPRDLSESYDLLDKKIVGPLERVPGVAQVRLDGVNPREVRINLRLADLEAHRLDVRTVAQILRGTNFDQSLGRIVEGDAQYTLRTVGTFASLNEIAELPLRDDGLKLRDVADVVFEEPPLEYGRHLDGDFAIGITVSTEAKANAVEVCEELERRIAAMGGDPELEGVNFLVWFSQGAEIKRTLTDLAFTGVFGALLSSIVLYVFLRRFTTTLVAVSCIPFALIVTCGVVWAQGKSLNTLTLLGLIVGIGMLVDNAVVVMENIFRHQERGLDQRQATRLGAAEVSTAVLAATLTSVIVFLPMIFNEPSEMSLYLRELGITVSITLLASLFISQTLIPLATSWFLRQAPARKAGWMEALEGRYGRVLNFTLSHRWLAPLIWLTVIALGAWSFTSIDKNFDHNESELFVQIRYDFSEELSLDRKEEVVSQVETALEPHRQALKARSIYSFWSDRWTLTRVYLREGEASEENIAAVRTTLKEVLPEMAGLKLEVLENRQFWRQDRGKRVAFQLIGEDTEVLARLAEEAKERLTAIDGLHDAGSSNAEGSQELHVAVDHALTSRYRVSPRQAAEVVGLTFRGQRLQRFRSGQTEREMRLTLDERRTESVAQLANLPLWSAAGTKIPLAAVAEVAAKPGSEQIQRDERLTSVWVWANYKEGSREEYMPRVTQALEAMTFPYGYSWSFGRWQHRREEQSRELGTNFALALLLVFAVMAGLFESIRQAIGLMIALPPALAGGAWALHLTGTDLDTPAMVGVFLLVGIVVNNGIVMIEHINGYRRGGTPRRQAMLRGARERLRPIVMTALTTLIGLVPIALQKPSLGGIYYYSMALVLMGGLTVSTFLTTLLLPTTVTLVEDAPAALMAVGRRLRAPWRRAARPYFTNP